MGFHGEGRGGAPSRVTRPCRQPLFVSHLILLNWQSEGFIAVGGGGRQTPQPCFQVSGGINGGADGGGGGGSPEYGGGSPEYGGSGTFVGDFLTTRPMGGKDGSATQEVRRPPLHQPAPEAPPPHSSPPLCKDDEDGGGGVRDYPPLSRRYGQRPEQGSLG